MDRERFGRTVLHVPDSRGFVAGAGDDEAAVTGEIEGVDFLLVAVEDVADALGFDVPDLGRKGMVSDVEEGMMEAGKNLRGFVCPRHRWRGTCRLD